MSTASEQEQLQALCKAAKAEGGKVTGWVYLSKLMAQTPDFVRGTPSNAPVASGLRFSPPPPARLRSSGRRR